MTLCEGFTINHGSSAFWAELEKKSVSGFKTRWCMGLETTKKNKLSAFKDRLQNKSFLWHNLMMKEGRKELPRLRDDSVSVYRAVGRSENPEGGTVFWIGSYADISWESRCSSEIKVWGNSCQILVVFEVPARLRVKLAKFDKAQWKMIIHFGYLPKT